MKVNSLKIDVTALKSVLGAGVRVEDIKMDLKKWHAVVRGYRDDDDTVVMVIDGDIDFETVEDVFEGYGVNVDDFIIDDTIPAYDDVEDDEYADIPAYDEVDDDEVFDNENCDDDDCDINERRGDCCPKKKVNMISLSEVFHGSHRGSKKTLDEVIDHMSGKSVSKSVAEAAITKARLSAKVRMIRENLGEERFARISKALNEGKDSAYENTKINGKAVSEYKLEELEALKKKCDEKLKKLTECGDADKKTEECKKLKKLSEILEDEISYRKAKDVAENSGLEMKSLNPNDVAKVDEADDEEKNDDEEKKDDDEKNDDEKNDDEKKDDDNDNPDEDEEVEIGSIIVTLASKDAAEDLKQDLVDAGVPEDVIEVEPVENEDEDEDKDEDEKSDSEEDNAEKENPEESVKHRGKGLNEADDDDNADDANKDADKNEDDSDEDDSDDSDEIPEGAYKLILTDTDYVNELSDVLENIWGMEHSEFEELIGGEVVSADDSEDSEEDKGDEESDAEDADDMDFDPDEIFKDL